MKAICWEGKHDVQFKSVQEPNIVNPRDVIVKVSCTAICGSDLHIYDGHIPNMKSGTILGHEFMGEIVEVGPRIASLRQGDKVVVSFAIACGQCFFCKRKLFSLCDNSNPNSYDADKVYGHSGGAVFGHSHVFGGYPGGQAEYVRVPFADVGCLKIPTGIEDDKVLLLSDVFPTAYMAAENCNIVAGDTVAIWGCGAVGLLAIKSAYFFGAEKVIAIDRFPERLQLAENTAGAEVINYEQSNVFDEIQRLTGGRGPDSCIDAVGLEAHGHTLDSLYDRAKTAVHFADDNAHSLREAIQCCRKGGVLSVPGVYSGFVDRFPLGTAFSKGLSVRLGLTHVQQYMRLLLEKILNGDIDPSFVISHRLPLEKGPDGYHMFKKKENHCIKVVFKTTPESCSPPSSAPLSPIGGP